MVLTQNPASSILLTTICDLNFAIMYKLVMTSTYTVLL